MMLLRYTIVAFTVIAGCANPSVNPMPLTVYMQLGSEDLALAGFAQAVQRVRALFVLVRIVDGSGDGVDRREGRSSVVNGASGVIIDPRGYVLTAAHVAVDTGFTAEVTTLDGRVHPGRVVDVERGSELAVLRIESAAELPAARLATQSRPAAGDPVLVIGTAGGRAAVVAPGRVLVPDWPERITYGGYGYDKALKLVADVEPGFSGGPVFDERGELIGMLASFVIGETRRLPYASPGVAYAVRASSIADYLSALLPPHQTNFGAERGRSLPASGPSGTHDRLPQHFLPSVTSAGDEPHSSPRFLHRQS